MITYKLIFENNLIPITKKYNYTPQNTQYSNSHEFRPTIDQVERVEHFEKQMKKGHRILRGILGAILGTGIGAIHNGKNGLLSGAVVGALSGVGFDALGNLGRPIEARIKHGPGNDLESRYHKSLTRQLTNHWDMYH